MTKCLGVLVVRWMSIMKVFELDLLMTYLLG